MKIFFNFHQARLLTKGSGGALSNLKRHGKVHFFSVLSIAKTYDELTKYRDLPGIGMRRIVMTKENCPRRGKACSARVSIEDELPVCKRKQGQLNGRYYDKRPITHRCRKHNCAAKNEEQCRASLIVCGCFDPE